MAQVGSQERGQGSRREPAVPGGPQAGREPWYSMIERPGVVYGLLLVAGLLFTLVPSFQRYPSDWIGRNPFYSHGSLVLLLTAYMVFDRWPSLMAMPRRWSWIGILVCAALLYACWVASADAMSIGFSILIFLALLAAIWAIAGVSWLRLLFAPAALFSAGLPVWQPMVEWLTASLQGLSISHAVSILAVLGLHPMRLDAGTLLLDRCELVVGTPLTGVRIFWAVLVVTVFLIMVSRMHLWANVVLCLASAFLMYALNVARISAAGIVGCSMGAVPGAKVLEVGGFLILILSFFLLYRLTKLLGWNN